MNIRQNLADRIAAYRATGSVDGQAAAKAP
jgi:hypothetical protein